MRATMTLLLITAVIGVFSFAVLATTTESTTTGGEEILLGESTARDRPDQYLFDGADLAGIDPLTSDELERILRGDYSQLDGCVSECMQDQISNCIVPTDDNVAMGQGAATMITRILEVVATMGKKANAALIAADYGSCAASIYIGCGIGCDGGPGTSCGAGSCKLDCDDEREYPSGQCRLGDGSVAVCCQSKDGIYD